MSTPNLTTNDAASGYKPLLHSLEKDPLGTLSEDLRASLQPHEHFDQVPEDDYMTPSQLWDAWAPVIQNTLRQRTRMDAMSDASQITPFPLRSLATTTLTSYIDNKSGIKVRDIVHQEAIKAGVPVELSAGVSASTDDIYDSSDAPTGLTALQTLLAGGSSSILSDVTVCAGSSSQAAVTETWSLASELCGELTCQICFSLFDTPVCLPCKHNMCAGCVENLLNSSHDPTHTKSECPFCKQSFRKRDVNPDRQLARLVQSALDTHWLAVAVATSKAREVRAGRFAAAIAQALKGIDKKERERRHRQRSGEEAPGEQEEESVEGVEGGAEGEGARVRSRGRGKRGRGRANYRDDSTTPLPSSTLSPAPCPSLSPGSLSPNAPLPVCPPTPPLFSLHTTARQSPWYVTHHLRQHAGRNHSPPSCPVDLADVVEGTEVQRRRRQKVREGRVLLVSDVVYGDDEGGAGGDDGGANGGGGDDEGGDSGGGDDAGDGDSADRRGGGRDSADDTGNSRSGGSSAGRRGSRGHTSGSGGARKRSDVPSSSADAMYDVQDTVSDAAGVENAKNDNIYGKATDDDFPGDCDPYVDNIDNDVDNCNDHDDNIDVIDRDVHAKRLRSQHHATSQVNDNGGVVSNSSGSTSDQSGSSCRDNSGNVRATSKDAGHAQADVVGLPRIGELHIDHRRSDKGQLIPGEHRQTLPSDLVSLSSDTSSLDSDHLHSLGNHRTELGIRKLLPGDVMVVLHSDRQNTTESPKALGSDIKTQSNIPIHSRTRYGTVDVDDSHLGHNDNNTKMTVRGESDGRRSNRQKRVQVDDSIKPIWKMKIDGKFPKLSKFPMLPTISSVATPAGTSTAITDTPDITPTDIATTTHTSTPTRTVAGHTSTSAPAARALTSTSSTSTSVSACALLQVDVAAMVRDQLMQPLLSLTPRTPRALRSEHTPLTEDAQHTQSIGDMNPARDTQDASMLTTASTATSTSTSITASDAASIASAANPASADEFYLVTNTGTNTATHGTDTNASSSSSSSPAGSPSSVSSLSSLLAELHQPRNNTWHVPPSYFTHCHACGAEALQSQWWVDDNYDEDNDNYNNVSDTLSKNSDGINGGTTNPTGRDTGTEVGGCNGGDNGGSNGGGAAIPTTLPRMSMLQRTASLLNGTMNSSYAANNGNNHEVSTNNGTITSNQEPRVHTSSSSSSCTPPPRFLPGTPLHPFLPLRCCSCDLTVHSSCYGKGGRWVPVAGTVKSTTDDASDSIMTSCHPSSSTFTSAPTSTSTSTYVTPSSPPVPFALQLDGWTWQCMYCFCRDIRRTYLYHRAVTSPPSLNYTPQPSLPQTHTPHAHTHAGAGYTHDYTVTHTEPSAKSEIDTGMSVCVEEEEHGVDDYTTVNMPGLPHIRGYIHRALLARNAIASENTGKLQNSEDGGRSEEDGFSEDYAATNAKEAAVSQLPPRLPLSRAIQCPLSGSSQLSSCSLQLSSSMVEPLGLPHLCELCPGTDILVYKPVVEDATEEDARRGQREAAGDEHSVEGERSEGEEEEDEEEDVEDYDYSVLTAWRLGMDDLDADGIGDNDMYDDSIKTRSSELPSYTPTIGTSPPVVASHYSFPAFRDACRDYGYLSCPLPPHAICFPSPPHPSPHPHAHHSHSSSYSSSSSPSSSSATLLSTPSLSNPPLHLFSRAPPLPRRWVHANCALWHRETVMKYPEALLDVRLTHLHPQKWRLKCAYCGGKGLKEGEEECVLGAACVRVCEDVEMDIEVNATPEQVPSAATTDVTSVSTSTSTPLSSCSSVSYPNLPRTSPRRYIASPRLTLPSGRRAMWSLTSTISYTSCPVVVPPLVWLQRLEYQYNGQLLYHNQQQRQNSSAYRQQQESHHQHPQPPVSGLHAPSSTSPSSAISAPVPLLPVGFVIVPSTGKAMSVAPAVLMPHHHMQHHTQAVPNTQHTTSLSSTSSSLATSLAMRVACTLTTACSAPRAAVLAYTLTPTHTHARAGASSAVSEAGVGGAVVKHNADSGAVAGGDMSTGKGSLSTEDMDARAGTARGGKARSRARGSTRGGRAGTATARANAVDTHSSSIGPTDRSAKGDTTTANGIGAGVDTAASSDGSSVLALDPSPIFLSAVALVTEDPATTTVATATPPTHPCASTLCETVAQLRQAPAVVAIALAQLPVGVLGRGCPGAVSGHEGTSNESHNTSSSSPSSPPPTLDLPSSISPLPSCWLSLLPSSADDMLYNATLLTQHVHLLSRYSTSLARATTAPNTAPTPTPTPTDTPSTSTSTSTSSTSTSTAAAAATGQTANVFSTQTPTLPLLLLPPRNAHTSSSYHLFSSSSSSSYSSCSSLPPPRIIAHTHRGIIHVHPSSSSLFMHSRRLAYPSPHARTGAPPLASTRTNADANISANAIAVGNAEVVTGPSALTRPLEMDTYCPVPQKYKPGSTSSTSSSVSYSAFSAFTSTAPSIVPITHTSAQTWRKMPPAAKRKWNHSTHTLSRALSLVRVRVPLSPRLRPWARELASICMHTHPSLVTEMVTQLLASASSSAPCHTSSYSSLPPLLAFIDVMVLADSPLSRLPVAIGDTIAAFLSSFTSPLLSHSSCLVPPAHPLPILPPHSPVPASTPPPSASSPTLSSTTSSTTSSSTSSATSLPWVVAPLPIRLHGYALQCVYGRCCTSYHIGCGRPHSVLFELREDLLYGVHKLTFCPQHRAKSHTVPNDVLVPPELKRQVQQLRARQLAAVAAKEKKRVEKERLLKAEKRKKEEEKKTRDEGRRKEEKRREDVEMDGEIQENARIQHVLPIHGGLEGSTGEEERVGKIEAEERKLAACGDICDDVERALVLSPRAKRPREEVHNFDTIHTTDGAGMSTGIDTCAGAGASAAGLHSDCGEADDGVIDPPRRVRRLDSSTDTTQPTLAGDVDAVQRTLASDLDAVYVPLSSATSARTSTLTITDSSRCGAAIAVVAAPCSATAEATTIGADASTYGSDAINVVDSEANALVVARSAMTSCDVEEEAKNSHVVAADSAGEAIGDCSHGNDVNGDNNSGLDAGISIHRRTGGGGGDVYRVRGSDSDPDDATGTHTAEDDDDAVDDDDGDGAWLDASLLNAVGKMKKRFQNIYTSPRPISQHSHGRTPSHTPARARTQARTPGSTRTTASTSTSISASAATGVGMGTGMMSTPHRGNLSQISRASPSHLSRSQNTPFSSPRSTRAPHHSHPLQHHHQQSVSQQDPSRTSPSQGSTAASQYQPFSPPRTRTVASPLAKARHLTLSPSAGPRRRLHPPTSPSSPASLAGRTHTHTTTTVSTGSACSPLAQPTPQSQHAPPLSLASPQLSLSTPRRARGVSVAADSSTQRRGHSTLSTPSATQRRALAMASPAAAQRSARASPADAINDSASTPASAAKAVGVSAGHCSCALSTCTSISAHAPAPASASAHIHATTPSPRPACFSPSSLSSWRPSYTVEPLLPSSAWALCRTVPSPLCLPVLAVAPEAMLEVVAAASKASLRAMVQSNAALHGDTTTTPSTFTSTSISASTSAFGSTSTPASASAANSTSLSAPSTIFPLIHTLSSPPQLRILPTALSPSQTRLVQQFAQVFSQHALTPVHDHSSTITTAITSAVAAAIGSAPATTAALGPDATNAADNAAVADRGSVGADAPSPFPPSTPPHLPSPALPVLPPALYPLVQLHHEWSPAVNIVLTNAVSPVFPALHAMANCNAHARTHTSALAQLSWNMYLQMCRGEMNDRDRNELCTRETREQQGSNGYVSQNDKSTGGIPFPGAHGDTSTTTTTSTPPSTILLFTSPPTYTSTPALVSPLTVPPNLYHTRASTTSSLPALTLPATLPSRAPNRTIKYLHARAYAHAHTHAHLHAPADVSDGHSHVCGREQACEYRQLLAPLTRLPPRAHTATAPTSTPASTATPALAPLVVCIDYVLACLLACRLLSPLPFLAAGDMHGAPVPLHGDWSLYTALGSLQRPLRSSFEPLPNNQRFSCSVNAVLHDGEAGAIDIMKSSPLVKHHHPNPHPHPRLYQYAHTHPLHVLHYFASRHIGSPTCIHSDVCPYSHALHPYPRTYFPLYMHPSPSSSSTISWSSSSPSSSPSLLPPATLLGILRMLTLIQTTHTLLSLAQRLTTLPSHTTRTTCTTHTTYPSVDMGVTEGRACDDINRVISYPSTYTPHSHPRSSPQTQASSSASAFSLLLPAEDRSSANTSSSSSSLASSSCTSQLPSAPPSSQQQERHPHCLSTPSPVVALDLSFALSHTQTACYTLQLPLHALIAACTPKQDKMQEASDARACLDDTSITAITDSPVTINLTATPNTLTTVTTPIEVNPHASVPNAASAALPLAATTAATSPSACLRDMVGLASSLFSHLTQHTQAPNASAALAIPASNPGSDTGSGSGSARDDGDGSGKPANTILNLPSDPYAAYTSLYTVYKHVHTLLTSFIASTASAHIHEWDAKARMLDASERAVKTPGSSKEALEGEGVREAEEKKSDVEEEVEPCDVYPVSLALSLAPRNYSSYFPSSCSSSPALSSSWPSSSTISSSAFSLLLTAMHTPVFLHALTHATCRTTDTHTHAHAYINTEVDKNLPSSDAGNTPQNTTFPPTFLEKSSVSFPIVFPSPYPYVDATGTLRLPSHICRSVIASSSFSRLLPPSVLSNTTLPDSNTYITTSDEHYKAAPACSSLVASQFSSWLTNSSSSPLLPSWFSTAAWRDLLSLRGRVVWLCTSTQAYMHALTHAQTLPTSSSTSSTSSSSLLAALSRPPPQQARASPLLCDVFAWLALAGACPILLQDTAMLRAARGLISGPIARRRVHPHADLDVHAYTHVHYHEDTHAHERTGVDSSSDGCIKAQTVVHQSAHMSIGAGTHTPTRKDVNSSANTPRRTQLTTNARAYGTSNIDEWAKTQPLPRPAFVLYIATDNGKDSTRKPTHSATTSSKGPNKGSACSGVGSLHTNGDTTTTIDTYMSNIWNVLEHQRSSACGTRAAACTCGYSCTCRSLNTIPDSVLRDLSLLPSERSYLAEVQGKMSVTGFKEEVEAKGKVADHTFLITALSLDGICDPHM